MSTTEALTQATVVKAVDAEMESGMTATAGDTGGMDYPQMISRDKFAGAKVVWREAFQVWGMAWELHVYGYAIGFLLLGVWGTVHTVKSATRKSLPSKAYYVTMNALVALCSFGRTFYLLTLTYGTRKLVPRMVGLLPKFSMFPCITSCFVLLFGVFMQLTRMQVVSQRLFTARKLITVVTVNFVLAYTADILAEYTLNGAVFYFVCDTYFVSWGLISSSAYAYAFLRFYMRVVVNRRKLNELAIAESTEGTTGEKRKGADHSLDTKLPTAAKVTLVAAVNFFLIGAVNVYRFVLLFSQFHLDVLPPVDPWWWWCYNTFMRGFEFMMNVTIAFVAALPFYEAK